MWVSLLASKECVVEAIKRIQAAVERKSGNKLGALRTNIVGEFNALQFKEYCAEIGIRRELTAPCTPQQNGVVERRNQIVMDMAKCMLEEKKLPDMFWGEAVSCAVYILNRTDTNGADGKTPSELWTRSIPAVQHLRTFGSIAHVKVNKPNLKKLDDRSKKMIFVGYEPGSAAYKCYDPNTQRVHISRDVIFEEEASWDWGEVDREFTVTEYTEDFQAIGIETSALQDSGVVGG
jgi:hypothetical protein